MLVVKVSDLFKRSENWYSFYVYFYNYKLCGELPDIFGRDAELDLDNFYHIHLATYEKIQEKWRATAIQYNRTTKLNEPNNDYWLIYAFDELHNEYLLLTIIEPDAHNRTDWNCFLRTINHEIVIPWINGSVIYDEPEEE